jgi:hypothetical protein
MTLFVYFIGIVHGDNLTQGRKKHQDIGGGGRGRHRFPGALLDIEKGTKKISPEMLATVREGKKNFPVILERLRYPGSGSRIRVSPFCLPTFADVSIFTRNFNPFPRDKPWSTRKRQTGTGVFCLLYFWAV